MNTTRDFFQCPLPPPDNHLHATGQYGRYARPAYKDWLQIARPLLLEALGDAWEPDTARWWRITVSLHLGSRGDGQNYLKPLLDLLSGAYVVEQAFTDAKGRKISKGTILHGRGLWDDDCRVACLESEVIFRRCAYPMAIVSWEPCPAPGDERARLAEEARWARQEAREAAKRAKQERQGATRESALWQAEKAGAKSR